MIEFITTLYNEEKEIVDLLRHVYPYVDKINVIDDGSTDMTYTLLYGFRKYEDEDAKLEYKKIDHTGLCELGRIEALKMCADDSWIVMLDADERFRDLDLEQVVNVIRDPNFAYTHIYFSQHEYIDGVKVAEFAKVKIFKKSAAHLPEIIHRDPQFDGDAINLGGVVLHRKTSSKQINREQEYLETYQKLLEEGKVTEDDVKWFRNMHHYVR